MAAAIDAWSTRPTPEALTGRSADELAAELASLPAEPVGDLSPDPSVLSARQRLESVRAALDSLPGVPGTPSSAETGGLGEADLRRLADDLEASAGAVDAGVEGRAADLGRSLARLRSRRTVAALVIVAGAVLVAVGAAVGLPALLLLGAAGVVLGGAAAAWQQRAVAEVERAAAAAQAALEPARLAAAAAAQRRHAARATLSRAGLPSDVSGLRGLADATALAQRAADHASGLAAQRARLEHDIEDAEQGLRDALASHGVPTAAGADPAAASDAYVAECRQRSSQHVAALRHGALEQALESRLAAEGAANEARRRAEAAEAAIRGAAAKIGAASDGDLGEIVVALDRWRDTQKHAAEAAETAVREWQELQGLLGGGTLAGLEAEAADWRDRAGSGRGGEAAGELPADLSGDDLDELRRRSQGAARDHHRLEGEIGELARRLPSVDEAEESAAAARRELGRVQALGDVLDMTLELLRSAEQRAQRELAPYLASALRDRVAVVTGDRYLDVTVNPADLDVQLKEGADGQWRTARLLSQGTREQVYLLLRAAMAQYLATTGETAPLLLDEVTAQCDDDRTSRVLGAVHEISRDRQVVLFSHDTRVRDWAGSALRGRDRLITLGISH